MSNKTKPSKQIRNAIKSGRRASKFSPEPVAEQRLVKTLRYESTKGR